MAFELKISRPPIPSKVEWNYEELKGALTTSLADYKSRVYTAETLDVAKKDRAGLNKLKKAINDERIKREKEYLAPFNEFKAQTKEIIAMIDEVSDDIGSKIDVFEVERVNQKRAEIELIFREINTLDWLTFDAILEEKWLNKSVTASRVKLELNEKLDKIEEDLSTLTTLEEYSFESIEHYKKTLNITESILEGQRIGNLMALKQKVNVDVHDTQERKIEPIQSDTSLPTYKIKFEVNINKNQAIALAQFCKENGITLTKI